MNTFSKYVPNVFLAKCTEQHDKGEAVNLSTKYGKEVEVIIHNLVYSKDGFFFYSYVRADGFDSQARAAAKAEKLEGYAANAEKRSDNYYKESQEGRDFLSLGEPIKIGHHSERRHRALIERNWERMGKSVAETEKAKDYQRRAEFWANKADIINLSMPESLNYFEFELEQAKKTHQYLKDNPEKRPHSMSLQYANKAVNDIQEKVYTAIKLWGDEEDIKQINEEKRQQVEAKVFKSQKKKDIVERHGGFFAFNNDQFREGYEKAKEAGHLQEGDKIVHFGMGLYIPKINIDSFVKEYK